jgi:hypothetical protein
MDLFGPVGLADNGDTFILCMTDAHTRYTQLTIHTDEAPEIITGAILKHWVRFFGTPLQIAIPQNEET